MGRPKSMKQMQRMQEGKGQNSHQEQQSDDNQGSAKPFWQSVFTAVTHCGAGCTLGDIIAEWIIFAVGFTILGEALWPEYIGDYVLAYILGILFQFSAIAPMRGLGPAEGIWEAIKADTLSLTAFEIGLFGWMALYRFVLFPFLHVDTVTYWFMMQVGMILGFWTSYPVNWFLVKSGIKEAM
jgi:hypothetical protein